MSPLDLFGFANKLNEPPTDEVTRRCVVSRAYYSALHTVNSVFEKVKPAADGESSHAEIIGRVKTYSNQQLPGRMYASEIAKAMPKLRRLRNRADYELDDSFEQPICDEYLARVSEVLARCDDVLRMRNQADGQP